LKKSLPCILILLLVVSIALTSVIVHPTTIPEYPTISVYPTSYKAENIGVNFQINVTIQDATNLAGVEFKLGYNTTVLTATQIEYGGIFGTNYFPLLSEIHDAEGWLLYGVMEYFGEPAFNGSAVVATITFTATEFGSTVLDLYDTKLGDPSQPPIPIFHWVKDGFFFNEAFHDIAVSNVRANSTTVEAGESLAVNVTVTNGGNYSETFNVVVYADIISAPVRIDPSGRHMYVIDEITREVKEVPVGEITLGDMNITVGYLTVRIREITVGTQAVTGLAPGASTTLTVTWNTTGVEEGNYTMSAKSLLLDDDPRDNLFVDDTVTIKPPALVHNIAVTNVVPSPTEVTAGENVTISVTVKNKGNFTETFVVTVYYDSTAIVNQTNVTLANGTSTTLTFKWDTAGVSEGTYTISAKVPPVAGEREADKADNTYADGTVRVRGTAVPNIMLYAAAGIVIIIIVAIVVYIVKFRKPT